MSAASVLTEQRTIDQMQNRIERLQLMVQERDEQLRNNFDLMRGEMDDLWAAVQLADTKAATALSTPPQTRAGTNPQLLQKVMDQLVVDLSFQRTVLKQVLEGLDKASFTTVDVEGMLRNAPTTTAGVTVAEHSGVSTRVAILETEMFKTKDLVPLLRNRVKYLEERRAHKALERRNKIFKDQHAVEAFVIASGDPDLYRYCVDFVSLIMLAHDPFFTVSEGMASEAVAVKANYNLLLEARIALSYQITYPENIMRRSDKKEAAPTDGWAWSGTWSTFAHFEGTLNNGAHDRMKNDLRDVRESLQNAIDFAFPIDKKGTMHAVFTEQLTMSYDQAVAWVESLTPLFKAMKTGGLLDMEAWSRVLVYTKALFEDIKTVRACQCQRIVLL